MLIKKDIIFDRINFLRDSLIEKVKYIYDRQEHPKRDPKDSKEPEVHTVKGIKDKIEDNLEFKDNYTQKITEYINDFCNFLNSYLNRNGSSELAESIREVLVWAY